MYHKILCALAAIATAVSAHGYVDNATIAGVYYQGYQPYRDPYTQPPPQRPFRSIPGNGPVQDVTLMDLQCGTNSQPAPLYAGPVAAGSNISLRWTLWPDSHAGPVITYMAKCPNDNCVNYVPGTAAVWFKIAHGGRVGTSSTWATTPLMKPGNPYIYRIPPCLAPGAYIVRHEIIALHSAGSYPGAQFYPGCHQIRVTGSGTATGPAAKVSIPGVYKGTDPGVKYNMYQAANYTIPGPPVWSC